MQSHVGKHRAPLKITKVERLAWEKIIEGYFTSDPIFTNCFSHWSEFGLETFSLFKIHSRNYYESLELKIQENFLSCSLSIIKGWRNTFINWN
jgi:hypothetical protein